MKNVLKTYSIFRIQYNKILVVKTSLKSRKKSHKNLISVNWSLSDNFPGQCCIFKWFYNCVNYFLNFTVIESKKPHRITLLLQTLLLKDWHHLHSMYTLFILKIKVYKFIPGILLLKQFYKVVLVIWDDNQYFQIRVSNLFTNDNYHTHEHN